MRFSKLLFSINPITEDIYKVVRSELYDKDVHVCCVWFGDIF
jgi:hypothetical protein